MVGKTGDIGCQFKQLGRKRFGETLELWIISVGRVILPPCGSRLGFEGRQAVERHDGNKIVLSPRSWAEVADVLVREEGNVRLEKTAEDENGRGLGGRSGWKWRSCRG